MRTGSRWSLFAALMILLVAWVAPAEGRGQHEHGSAEASSGTQGDVAEALPEDLRALLNEEMRLIDGAMGEIGSALAVGDWEAVAAVATEIEGSFILKQSLTPEQGEILHSTLPSRFVELDMAFHGRAAALAHAAEAGDAEIAAHHFSRLVEGCISCHREFAPGRFPGLAKASDH